MGFLNGNDRLAYFAIIGQFLSGLSLTVGFSRLYVFSHYEWASSGGQEGETSQQPNVLVGLEDLISGENFCWLSALSLKDIPYNGYFRKTLNWVRVKHVLSK